MCFLIRKETFASAAIITSRELAILCEAVVCMTSVRAMYATDQRIGKIYSLIKIK